MSSRCALEVLVSSIRVGTKQLAGPTDGRVHEDAGALFLDPPALGRLAQDVLRTGARHGLGLGSRLDFLGRVLNHFAGDSAAVTLSASDLAEMRSLMSLRVTLPLLSFSMSARPAATSLSVGSIFCAA